MDATISMQNKNISEFIDQVNSYEIHKSKLNAIK